MYEALAQYYDLFMDEGDWIDFAVRSVEGKYRGVDVGCGSGEATMRLAYNRHDVIALDVSEQMLRVASEKFAERGLNIPVVRQSADSLSLPFKADFITAVCDVVNYLRRPEKFFKAAHDNLAKGGILAFDISSEYKLRSIIANNVFTQTKNDITYIWENSLYKNYVDMTVTFFVPTEKGLYRKYTDRQRQYIFSHEHIKQLLVDCGFKVRSKKKKDRSYFAAERID